MEIIIIMIVVSVVANIIKSAGQVQQQTKRTGRGIPGQTSIPGRGFHLPGNQPPGFDNYSMGESDFQIEQPLRQKETGMESRFGSDRETSYNLYERTAAPITDLSQPAPPMDIAAPLQAIGTNQSQKHTLDFSRESIINGIILSEVLGQPKSRRK